MRELSDYSRRRVLLSALAALSFVSTRRSVAGSLGAEGCFVAPQDLANITMYNPPPTGNAPLPFPPAGKAAQPLGERGLGSIQILSESDRDFDRDMGRVLVQLSGELGVTPGFGYYEDGDNKNACASPMTRIPGTRGTVLFGLGLLKSMRAVPDGDIAVLATCAHEFAHILQFQTGEIDRIKSRLREKYCAELYADFLAGYFLRLFHLERPRISVQGVGAAWEAMGSSDFNHPAAHGTGQQRVRALEAGYFFADRSIRGIDRAMSEAYSHVSQYG